MHILYLDDSGKVHPNDPCKVAVLAGFSVPVGNWHRLVRQISGAKRACLPNRGGGNPHAWEIKSKDFVELQKWQRAKNRNLCFELADVLHRNSCHVYAVSIEKSKVVGDLDENRFVPLMLQRLASRFYDQVLECDSVGSIVLDWSTHNLDEHVTRCVSSMVASQQMTRLVGGVTYGGSSALPPIQVADLIASAFRRHLEGEAHMADWVRRLTELQYRREGYLDANGFPSESICKVC